MNPAFLYLLISAIISLIYSVSLCMTHVYMCVFQFGGTEGEWFQKLTARFCSYQTYALDQIKQRQKKDARFNSFIQVSQ